MSNSSGIQDIPGLNLSGAVVPHGWYRSIQDESGQPDWVCISLLSRILHKHRKVWSPKRQEYVHQAGFRGKVFHTSLGQLQTWLCLQKEALCSALLRLQARGLIVFCLEDLRSSTEFPIHLLADPIADITNRSSSTTSALPGAARPTPKAESESNTTPPAAPAAEESPALDQQLSQDTALFCWWWRRYLQEFGLMYTHVSGTDGRVQRMLLAHPDYSTTDLLELAVTAWQAAARFSRPDGYEIYFHSRRAWKLAYFVEHVDDIATELYFWHRATPRAALVFKARVIGRERDAQQYIGRLMDVFRECWRVLKPHGTMWIVIDDAYSKKQLLGLPWRLMSALQAEGWIVRAEQVWAKSGMCEGAHDRTTRDHEFVFLLTKQPRGYYYDLDAIREPFESKWSLDCINKARENGVVTRPKTNPFSKQERREKGHRGITRSEYGALMNPLGRNRRSIWEVTTAKLKEEHYAAFPVELAKICIRAGCPSGGTCLDPFAGAGSTGIAAVTAGRKFVGIELVDKSAEIARRRIKEG